MEACIAEHLEDTWPDINSINEDDSYIEIELDTSPTCYNNVDVDDDDDGEGKEYQLRISISSTISMSLPDESLSLQTNVPKVAAIEAPCLSSLMSFPADDDTTRSTCAGSKEIMPLQHSCVSKIDEQAVEVEFSVQNRLCNTSIPFNSGVGLESPQSDGQKSILKSTRVIPCDNVDVLCASARKQPNLTTTTTTTAAAANGGMMKLFIKFRGIKIGALLASLLKPRQPSQANNNGHKSSKKSKTFFQCYQKRLVNPTNGRCNVKRDQGGRSNKHWDFEDDSICGSFRSSRKSSRVMEMDLGALRGMFNAMGMSIAQKASRSKRRAQPTSCDTTPIHEGFSLYSSENSNIQAAIAYCKSSFGQTSDFSF